MVKNMPANAGSIRDTGSIPGLGRSPAKGTATHTSRYNTLHRQLMDFPANPAGGRDMVPQQDGGDTWLGGNSE